MLSKGFRNGEYTELNSETLQTNLQVSVLIILGCDTIISLSCNLGELKVLLGNRGLVYHVQHPSFDSYH